MNRRYKYKSKFKRKHRWTRLKEIETDYSRGFGKLASLASSFSKFLIYSVYIRNYQSFSFYRARSAL